MRNRKVFTRRSICKPQRLLTLIFAVCGLLLVLSIIATSFMGNSTEDQRKTNQGTDAKDKDALPPMSKKEEVKPRVPRPSTFKPADHVVIPLEELTMVNGAEVPCHHRFWETAEGITRVPATSCSGGHDNNNNLSRYNSNPLQRSLSDLTAFLEEGGLLSIILREAVVYDWNTAALLSRMSTAQPLAGGSYTKGWQLDVNSDISFGIPDLDSELKYTVGTAKKRWIGATDDELDLAHYMLLKHPTSSIDLITNPSQAKCGKRRSFIPQTFASVSIVGGLGKPEHHWEAVDVLDRKLLVDRTSQYCMDTASGGYDVASGDKGKVELLVTKGCIVYDTGHGNHDEADNFQKEGRLAKLSTRRSPTSALSPGDPSELLSALTSLNKGLGTIMRDPFDILVTSPSKRQAIERSIHSAAAHWLMMQVPRTIEKGWGQQGVYRDASDLLVAPTMSLRQAVGRCLLSLTYSQHPRSFHNTLSFGSFPITASEKATFLVNTLTSLSAATVSPSQLYAAATVSRMLVEHSFVSRSWAPLAPKSADAVINRKSLDISNPSHALAQHGLHEAWLGKAVSSTRAFSGGESSLAFGFSTGAVDFADSLKSFYPKQSESSGDDPQSRFIAEEAVGAGMFATALAPIPEGFKVAKKPFMGTHYVLAEQPAADTPLQVRVQVKPTDGDDSIEIDVASKSEEGTQRALILKMAAKAQCATILAARSLLYQLWRLEGIINQPCPSPDLFSTCKVDEVLRDSLYILRRQLKKAHITVPYLLRVAGVVPNDLQRPLQLLCFGEHSRRLLKIFEETSSNSSSSGGGNGASSDDPMEWFDRTVLPYFVKGGRWQSVTSATWPISYNDGVEFIEMGGQSDALTHKVWIGANIPVRRFLEGPRRASMNRLQQCVTDLISQPGEVSGVRETTLTSRWKGNTSLVVRNQTDEPMGTVDEAAGLADHVHAYTIHCEGLVHEENTPLHNPMGELGGIIVGLANQLLLPQTDESVPNKLQEMDLGVFEAFEARQKLKATIAKWKARGLAALRGSLLPKYATYEALRRFKSRPPYSVHHYVLGGKSASINNLAKACLLKDGEVAMATTSTSTTTRTVKVGPTPKPDPHLDGLCALPPKDESCFMTFPQHGDLLQAVCDAGLAKESSDIPEGVRLLDIAAKLHSDNVRAERANYLHDARDRGEDIAQYPTLGKKDLCFDALDFGRSEFGDSKSLGFEVMPRALWRHPIPSVSLNDAMLGWSHTRTPSVGGTGLVLEEYATTLAHRVRNASQHAPMPKPFNPFLPANTFPSTLATLAMIATGREELCQTSSVQAREMCSRSPAVGHNITTMIALWNLISGVSERSQGHRCEAFYTSCSSEALALKLAPSLNLVPNYEHVSKIEKSATRGFAVREEIASSALLSAIHTVSYKTYLLRITEPAPLLSSGWGTRNRLLHRSLLSCGASTFLGDELVRPKLIIHVGYDITHSANSLRYAGTQHSMASCGMVPMEAASIEDAMRALGYLPFYDPIAFQQGSVGNGRYSSGLPPRSGTPHPTPVTVAWVLRGYEYYCTLCA